MKTNSIKPTVILTRPEGKNEALVAALQRQNPEVKPLVLPALCLSPTLTKLPEAYWPTHADLLIFVSAQAAQYYLEALAAAGQHFLPQQRLATVGAASAQPFYEAGLAKQVQLIHPPVTHPYQDSEALWELLQPELNEINRVLLVRGQQGREWLSERLLAANKRLIRCCIYERLPAEWHPNERSQLHHALSQPSSVTMLLTSSESTQAIYQNIVQLGLLPAWKQCHFVVIHPRIAENLQALIGLSASQRAQQITVCAPSQAAMLNALRITSL